MLFQNSVCIFDTMPWWDSKSLGAISKNANMFCLHQPIVIRRMLIDSLDHAKNTNTSFVIIGQTSCLPFWFMLKTIFFQTPPRTLVRLSPNLTQIIFRPNWPKKLGFRVNIWNVSKLVHQRICWKDTKLHLRLYLCKALTYWHQTLNVPLSPHTDHAT